MKIVIAPDSFKESLTAMEVANEIERGFRTVLPNAEYLKIPVADGGEGTVQSMVDATNGQLVWTAVSSPLGHKVNAFYGILGDCYHGNEKTAVIEMAAASGLHLVATEQRNPLVTTSYGTGELIVDALNRGIKHIIIGLGGSATNDGGAGMAQALGIQLLDTSSNPIAPGGAALSQLHHIDLTNLHPLVSECRFEVACDVNNPLCGEYGASAIFGPQKGATAMMVKQLDHALNHYADVITQLGIKDNRELPGVGAAGGMGLGVMAFLNAQLKPGIDIVMNTVDLASHIKDANLVITGEGKLDSQTLHGKTPMGVAGVSNQCNVPIIAIAGCVSDDANVLLDNGFTALFSITPRALPLADVLENAKKNLYTTSKNIAALYSLSMPTT